MTHAPRSVGAALKRGLLAVAANPSVAVAQSALALSAVVLGGIGAAGLAAGLLPLAVSSFGLPLPSGSAVAALVARLAAFPAVTALVAGLLGSLVAFSLLLAVASWLAAGTWEVLRLSDLAAAEDAPRERFRAPPGSFLAGGRRHGWTFFALLNAYGVAVAFVLTLALVGALAATLGVLRGRPAVWILALVLTVPTVVFLSTFAKVALEASCWAAVTGPRGALDAIASGTARLRETAGATVLLFLALLGVGLALAGVLAVPRFVVTLLLRDASGPRLLALLGLLAGLVLVEIVAVSGFDAVRAGAFISLWNGLPAAAPPREPSVPPFAPSPLPAPPAGRAGPTGQAAAAAVLAAALLLGCTAKPRPRGAAEGVPVAPAGRASSSPSAPAPAPDIVQEAPVPAYSFPEPAGETIDVGLASNARSYLVPEGTWLVRSGGVVERTCGPLTLAPSGEIGKLLAGEGDARRQLSSPVEVAPAGKAPVTWQETRYRGILRLFPNAKGSLTVVNRAGLEDYLKGVVPAEMGPRVYDELEALKAQAVAARSYAVRRRGESAAEGYDLCATPRCQVYGGVSAENPLSSRAVEETAGEILAFSGKVADALFTSTCGGRTEDAANVFTTWASRDYPYLASVSCAGEVPVVLVSGLPRGHRPMTLLGVRGRALLAGLGRKELAWADLVAARDELRERLGLPRGGGPKTLQASVVYGDLYRAASLEGAGRLLEAGEEEQAPSGWPAPARVALAVARRFQLGGGSPLPVSRAFRPEEAAGLYAALLGRMGEFEEADARVIAAGPEGLLARTAKGKLTLPLAASPALFTGAGDEWDEAEELKAFPGDRVRLFSFRGQVAAVALVVGGAPGQYERDSAWVHWIRRSTGEELMSRLREREATRKGTEVRRVEILERGSSGRVRRLRVTTDAGTSVLSGLEIRFALALPDTLFTVVSGKGEKGEAVFTFFGRGWGHGVGLCQNGAFGMALAGHGYREILSHYYPGTEVVPISSLPRPPTGVRRVE